MKKIYLLSTVLATGIAFGQCVKPWNVTVDQKTPHSVTVTAEDESLTYDIVSTALPGTINLATAVPTYNDVSSPFTPSTYLANNYTYEFYVRTDCGDSVSEWVGPFKFTTIDLAACPEPTGVQAIDITTNGATVVADDTSANYDFISTGTPGSLDTASFNETTTPIFNNVTSPRSFTGLPSGSTFEYWVRKDCGQVAQNLNVSPWTGPHYFTTLVPCELSYEDISIVSVGSNSVTATSTDTTSLYDVRSTANPDNLELSDLNASTTPNFADVEAPFYFNSLTPNWDYEFYVRKVCGETKTAWVGPFNFTTTGSPARIAQNPVRDMLTLENVNAVSATIVGLASKAQVNVNVVNNQVNVSNLPVGNYVINVTDAKGGVQTIKFIKK